MKQRILNILIDIDQLIYVLITLGGGNPDETLSAAAWRTEKTGKLLGTWFRPVIDFIFYPIEKNHCYKSFIAEKQSGHLPEIYKS